MLNIIIIEDEKLTAQDLAKTLNRIDPDINIRAILSTVEDAIRYFKTEPLPDLIFSDIELTDGISFDIFKQVKINVPVVFCTAYDQYALKAFEVNGIDYILKPFSIDSISKAIDKFQLLKGNIEYPTDIYSQLKEIITNERASPKSSIIVYHGDKIIPILINNIALCYIEDGYVFALLFDKKKYLISHTLDELERICGFNFFRANRQYLVNRKTINNAVRFSDRKTLLSLNIDFPDKIIISKLKVRSFVEWLAGR